MVAKIDSSSRHCFHCRVEERWEERGFKRGDKEDSHSSNHDNTDLSHVACFKCHKEQCVSQHLKKKKEKNKQR